LRQRLEVAIGGRPIAAEQEIADDSQHRAKPKAHSAMLQSFDV
jgi:hypothetical protein